MFRFQVIASWLVLLLMAATAAPSLSGAPALSRFVDYLVEEGVIKLKICELIQQQGDLCFSAEMTNAAKFSEALDNALLVFHGIGLSRDEWFSGNGVWSTKIFSPREFRSLEVFISETEFLEARLINGVIMIR